MSTDEYTLKYAKIYDKNTCKSRLVQSLGFGQQLLNF
ncbi:hypothetical protein NIES2100_02660 [Calothrix sp. NIES-2100]|nr:hypothetical protein NIES2100_02660 [Calothrix sp. NIES-2100]